MLCLISFHYYGHAQTFFNILNSPLDTVQCNDTCIYIYTEHLDVKKTTSYNASTIPFNPITITSGTNIILQDDKFSSAIPIGFDFCFYGNSYSQVYASSNGHLTFNSLYATQDCSFETQQPLPYYNSKFPDNAIFAPFVDFNIMLGGTITYSTIGIAPFRKFIIEYSNIPYFGGICTGSSCNYQCILNETYNNINIFINSKTICNSNPLNWLNYATMGVQSIGASSSFTIPGRNASIWTATNEGWNIYPNGARATQIDWYDTSYNLLLLDADTINFCSAVYPRTVYAKIQYSCPSLILWDTIQLIKQYPSINNVVITNTSCKNTLDGEINIIGTTLYPPLTYAVDNISFNLVNNISSLSYGQHIIVITDNNGCTDTQYVFIPTNSTLTVIPNLVLNPVCPNDDGKICVSGFGGVPPYTFLWNTGDTTLCIDSLASGLYFVTITDASGCEDQKSFSLAPTNVPIVYDHHVTKPVCHQNGAINISVYNGIPPYTYFWSNGATTQNISGLTNSGWYTVTIFDSIGCLNSFSFLVVDTLIPQVDLNVEKLTTCGHSNGKLSVIGSDAIQPYTYLWSTSDTSQIISNLSSGIYTCTVTDANNCTNTSSIFLNPSYPLSIQFFPANAHCDILNNGAINTTISNSTAPIQYLWNTGDNTNSITSLFPGVYSLNIIDTNGCVASDSVEILNDGSPHLELLSYTPPLCFGDSNGSVILGGFSGAAPYKYSFDGITFYTNAQINNIPAGSYPVYIRDANSCLRDTTIVFSQPTPVLIDSIVSDTLICFHDIDTKIKISANGGTPPYQYRINSGNWQSSPSFSNIASGIYLIEVSDTNGCIASFNFEHLLVGPESELKIELSKVDVECYQINSGRINAKIEGGWPPYSIHWNFSNSHELNLSNLCKGEYSIEVIDRLGCTENKQIELFQDDCCHLTMPNAFSPNNDQLNDVFKAISPTEINNIRLQIFNRWGQKIFSGIGLDKGWDGKIDGKDANMDTYYYLVEFECNLTLKTIVLKGDVLLIR